MTVPDRPTQIISTGYMLTLKTLKIIIISLKSGLVKNMI